MMLGGWGSSYSLGEATSSQAGWEKGYKQQVGMQNSLKYCLQGWIAVGTFCWTASFPFFILGESKKMGSRDEVLGSRSLKPALISSCTFETKARHLPSCFAGSPLSVKCCLCRA